MTTVQQDFQTRAGEIENYFRFVQRLADGEILLTASDAAAPPLSQDDSDSLLKTLKANGFILLYNLVESTMKNAIEAVFEEFRLAEIKTEVVAYLQEVLDNIASYLTNRDYLAVAPVGGMPAPALPEI